MPYRWTGNVVQSSVEASRKRCDVNGSARTAFSACTSSSRAHRRTRSRLACNGKSKTHSTEGALMHLAKICRSLIGLLALLHLAGPAPAADAIKIGYLDPLSGPFANV